jgi:tRNA threonylcarbamoyl adenosine modification protein (Sua5/YciO/YrdC/YwlC family)
MMSQFFSINLENPQHRLIVLSAEIIRSGGVIAYPTDSGYALGCMIGHGDAQKRIRQIRGADDKHLFTLVCRNLSELGNYAIVSNSQFRLLKANTPGAYTFILNATKEVPRKLQHPKRNTVGLRVPEHAIVQALLEEIDAPLLSMTLYIPGEDGELCEGWEIRDRLEHLVDLVIDAGHCVAGATSVINLTGDAPELIRAGLGNLEPFGLS